MKALVLSQNNETTSILIYNNENAMVKAFVHIDNAKHEYDQISRLRFDSLENFVLHIKAIIDAGADLQEIEPFRVKTFDLLKWVEE